MKNHLLTTLLCFSISLCFGQQKTLAKFIITDAAENNIDATERVLEAGGFLVIYETSDGELYMSNFMEKFKTQSYGRMYSSEAKKLNETFETYKADIFYYKWRYINSYDEKKGTATVKFMKIYKPQGVTFICTIIPENLDVIVYKGYMEGSLDFTEFNN